MTRTTPNKRAIKLYSGVTEPRACWGLAQMEYGLPNKFRRFFNTNQRFITTMELNEIMLVWILRHGYASQNKPLRFLELPDTTSSGLTDCASCASIGI